MSVLVFEHNTGHGQMVGMGDGESGMRNAQTLCDLACAADLSDGRPLGSRTTSISSQLTPWLMPVPRALAPASLAAKRAAKLSADLRFLMQ
jgi:hypothetical protein